MLTKDTPKTIKTTASVKHAGQDNPLILTYFNRSTEELTKFTKSKAMTDIPESHKDNPLPWMNGQVCLYLIKSFDDGTDEAFPLTIEGLLSMESHYPGVLMGLVQHFHTARQTSVEKN